jgi:hypothetical protein
MPTCCSETHVHQRPAFPQGTTLRPSDHERLHPLGLPFPQGTTLRPSDCERLHPLGLSFQSPVPSRRAVLRELSSSRAQPRTDLPTRHGRCASFTRAATSSGHPGVSRWRCAHPPRPTPHSPVPLPLPGASRRGPAHPQGSGPHSSTPCRPLLRTAGVPRKGPAHPQGSGPRSPTPCRPLLRTAGVPRKGPAHPLQSERLAHPCRHLLRHLEPPAGDLLTRRSQCVSLSRTVPPPLRTLVGRRSHWLTATVSGPLPHTASAPPPSTREPRARSRALMTAEGLPPPPPRSRFHPPEITSGESREARVADNLIHPQSAC